MSRNATPVVRSTAQRVTRLGEDPLPTGLGTSPVALNFDGIPLSAFVSEALGNLLNVQVRVAPEVVALQDPITLRTPAPQQPDAVYRLVQQVLADYGVQVRVEEGLVQVRKSAEGAGDAPFLIANDRIGSAAQGFRPVLQIYELEVVRSTDALRWLQSLFGRELTVESDDIRNALMIRGRPASVRQAIDALRVFDAPGMRGRVSAKLEPAFIPAAELADRLVEALVAQGYGAARTLGVPASILAIPIPSANSILVFASSPETLEYAVQWARELDKPNPTSAGPSLFYYQVKNTKAEELAAILGGADGIASSNTADRQSSETPAAEATAAGAQVSVQGGTMLVDRPRNALIFRGDAATWQRMLPLIHQMDRAPRQVMIEVTVAEVILSDDEQFGINWGGRDSPGRFSGRFQLGSLPNSDLNPAAGTGSSAPDTGDAAGFVYQLAVGGSVRARLNALANDNRISVLSTPRLMVKSGAEASIDVGNEVPTLTSQTVSGQQTEGSSALIQGIQYRKTGILLNIKPTVYSEDRVDLEIMQEVSEAQPVGSGAAVQSPAIFNRSLRTSISLRDGQSHILGGLMSRRENQGRGGVPGLKDIPFLGGLFRNQNNTNDRTELVLIITPYIVESDDDARAITDAVRSQLQLIRLPSDMGVDAAGKEE